MKEFDMISANDSTGKKDALLKLAQKHDRAMGAAKEAPSEELKVIKVVLKNCLRRGASFDEFKTLVKERFNNEI